MRARRAHPAVCLIALVAYLLNLAFVAGGAVLCSDPHGQARVELACDHDHCSTVIEIDHEHDASDACCRSGCPCQDSSLGITITATLRDDEQHVRLSSSSNSVIWAVAAVTPPEVPTRFVGPYRSPPWVDRHLRQLRTVVLIV